MDWILIILMGALVGFFLGFFGSGGSVLTVPILVYVLGLDPKEAIVSSLVIVGVTALAGGFQKIRQHQVCYKIALIFGGFGVVGAFGGAKLSVLFSGSQQLIIFAILMLAAAFFMLKNKKTNEASGSQMCRMNMGLASSLGLGVGGLTGLVGVGGGFLIVPALSQLGGLHLTVAMGTSLLIITLNALAGVLGYLGVIQMDLPLIFVFMAASSLMSMIGSHVGSKMNAIKMKKVFAGFIILIGVLLLFKNTGMIL